MGEERKVKKVWVEKPERRRPRRGWEDWIRIDLRETGWGIWSGLNWLGIWTGDRLF
jgi:hypothetical protein